MYYKIIRPLIKKIFYLLCAFALRILSYLFFWIRPKPLNSENINKILLIKMERIGDLVLSTPAIRAIRERLPKSYISIIVNPSTKQIIEKDPNINEIIVWDVDNTHRSLKQKTRFIRELRKKGFDLGIDLNTRDFFFLPIWLLYLSGAKITLGLDNFGRGFLFNIKVKPYRQPKPLTEEVLHILSPLGITTSDIQPRLFVSDADNNYIQGILIKEGVNKNDCLVCIHPGGVYETKYWRKDGYAKVAQRLIRKYNAKVFFIGGHKERKLVNEIIGIINEKAINLAGEITLVQLMALISRCQLFIGNNSGPLHIAAAFNIPTISFLGPGIPERWQPQGKNNIVFRRDLPCSPCELGYCWRKDFACMREIKPEEVIDAVDRQLQSQVR